MSLLIQKLLLICVLTFLSMHNVLGVPRRHVNIVNSLEDNLNLTIHCKSADDDLGSHLLHHGDSYGFKFLNDFFADTQFFCSFQWEGEFKWYDIYIASRDSNKCYICNWYIQKSGPCRVLYPEGSGSECFPWNINH